MKASVLRALCDQARVECRPYDIRTPRGQDVVCFSIATGDQVNAILDLIAVVADNEVAFGQEPGHNTARVIHELCCALKDARQAPTLDTDQMTIILYWPKIGWES
jgi:hypothetical protein